MRTFHTAVRCFLSWTSIGSEQTQQTSRTDDSHRVSEEYVKIWPFAVKMFQNVSSMKSGENVAGHPPEIQGFKMTSACGATRSCLARLTACQHCQLKLRLAGDSPRLVQIQDTINHLLDPFSVTITLLCHPANIHQACQHKQNR